MDQSQLARRLLEVIPPLMHEIRRQVRDVAKDKLTVPQLRILANINRGLKHVGEIANHHGVSQPAMSKMVDSLVTRQLVTRVASTNDRRQNILTLTPKGQALFQGVKAAAQKRMALALSEMPERQCKRLLDALDALEGLHTSKEPK